MKPRLIIEQKITALVNKYHVYEVNERGEKSELLALAQQKRLAFKEKVLFYRDTSKTELVFTFRAEKVMDIHGRFFVEDESGKRIGAFKKNFKQSLVNSTWQILHEDDRPHMQVSESNQAIAILRRFIGFIPIVGDLGEIVMAFFKYHFRFIDLQTSQEVGRYQKTTLLRDHYQLSMTDDAWRRDDWRTYAAMAVALDALQDR